MCTFPRANHELRTVPPLLATVYARFHDQAVWETLLACIGGGPPTIPDHANELTRSLASLPAALMGLGLTSAKRSAPVASWAAWADALSVLHTRQPVFAAVCAEAFADPQDCASGL